MMNIGKIKRLCRSRAVTPEALCCDLLPGLPFALFIAYEDSSSISAAARGAHFRITSSYEKPFRSKWSIRLFVWARVFGRPLRRIRFDIARSINSSPAFGQILG